MGEIERFMTAGEREIYRIPVRSFPGLITNVHVIVGEGHCILVDTGSGFGEANGDLVAGLAEVGPKFGRKVGLEDLTEILITHGHIDHFGALPFIREHNRTAPIGIHVLDRQVLANHRERVLVAARRLDTFLVGAGVKEGWRQELMKVYLWGKQFYESTPVQFLLEDGIETVAGIQVYHAPGHCSGQVCLQVDDVLMTADHILAKTTPHQTPESITRNMGLGHYLASLDKIKRVEGVRLGLGGHEEPITDVGGRIEAIKKSHERRLDKVLGICKGEPQSIADISRALFGKVESYHILLALEEAGAHVEYLYDRGELVAANLEEIEREALPVVKYVVG
ncbi:MAG TPA: MBL fold metallo-hydrolase [Anaerolineae bacterium]|nr:MBL fold metallo-hydrolase [Anaerolineae bacterium]